MSQSFEQKALKKSRAFDGQEMDKRCWNWNAIYAKASALKTSKVVTLVSTGAKNF